MTPRTAALIFVLAGALACGGGDSGTTYTPLTCEPGELSCLCVNKINEHRASIDLPPYKRWSAAETCADGQSEYDATTGIPHSAFGDCNESAQNECPGFPGDPEAALYNCLQLMWDEGSGPPEAGQAHYFSMANPAFDTVACGFHVTDDGKLWSVQDFK